MPLGNLLRRGNCNVDYMYSTETYSSGIFSLTNQDS